MIDCRSFHRCVLVMAISMTTLPSFGAPQPAAPAKTPIRPQALAIQWQDGSRTNDNDRQGCENLGSSLLIGADPWHHGIFTSHACFFGDEALDSSSPWRLRLRQDAAELHVGMDFVSTQDGQAQTTPLMEFTVPREPGLTDKTVAQLVALKILDELPMARPARISQASSQEPDAADGAAPEEYVVFTLQHSSLSGWVPRLVGTGKRTEGSSDLAITFDENQSEPFRDAPEGFLWAQVKGGPGAMASEIEARLATTSSGGLMSAFATGYAGMRFGPSFTKGDPLLEQSALVSVFTEIRGGPAQGLRWYWDFAPESRAVVDGKNASFTWSRASLGWSFGSEKKNWLGFFDRVDLVPKLGLMDLDARVPLAGAPGTTVLSTFRAKNILSLGLEAGLESHLPYFLLRLWAAGDFSGMGKLKRDTSVQSVRAGLDLYRDLFTFSQFRLALLGFAAAENQWLSRAESDIVAGTTRKLEGVHYSLLYMGAGLTVTW